MVQKLSIWVQVVYLCLAATLSVATAKTRLEDKRALLALKDLISSNKDQLANWVATSDPCSDSWSGISCTCSDLQAPLSALACYKATAGANGTVILLDFGAFSSKMTGLLAPEFGNLTYLQSLRLDGHHFQVTLPSSFSCSHRHLLVSSLQCSAVSVTLDVCVSPDIPYLMPYLLQTLTMSGLHSRLFTVTKLRDSQWVPSLLSSHA